MPTWLTLVAGGLKLLGLVDFAEKLIQSYLDRQRGREQQKQADDEASIKTAEQARKTEDGLKSLSDDDLDQRLRDSLS